MGDTNIAALEHTVEQTNLWLKRLEKEHHVADRQCAYRALRAVLHALRDRLTPNQAAHLGAQLPLLIRGIFYEGWHPAGTPVPDHAIEDFVARVARELPPQDMGDALRLTRAVLDIVWREIDPGEVSKVIASLPVPLRGLWPVPARV